MKMTDKCKRILWCVLSVVIVLASSLFLPNAAEPVYAAKEKVKQAGEYLYKASEDGKTVIFMGYTGKAEELTIPTEIKGKKVSKVEGFFGSKECKSKGPFCETVKTLSISGQITLDPSIPSKINKACPNLEKVVLQEGFNSIGNQFMECKKLTQVVLPDSLTTIGGWAFYGCENLTQINLPNGLTKIEQRAFMECTNLADITIPSGVTDIKDKAFTGTKWLTNKRLENPLVIVNGILIDGTAATGEVVIPDTVTSMIEHAFIEDVFVENTSITGVVIPKSITYIPSGAFYNCVNLANVSIQSSNISVDSNAFEKTKWIEGERAKNNGFVVINNTLIDADEVKGDAVLPSNITSYSGIPFLNCKATSITIPGTIKTIKEEAFLGCPVKKIVIEEGVEEIEEGAFEEAGVQELVIPASVKKIGSHAFSGASLRKITFLGVPEFVGGYHLACEVLETVNFAEGITTIPEGMFYCCKKLQITLPKSVSYIGKNAFYIDPDYEDNYAKNIQTRVVVLNPDCEFYGNKKTIDGLVFGADNSTATKYGEKYKKTVSLKAVKKSGTVLTVKWKQVKNVDGYQIQYGTNKKFKSAKAVTVKKAGSKSKTIKKVKANKGYYVRIRAYKQVNVDGKNQKVYTGWSAAKKVSAI